MKKKIYLVKFECEISFSTEGFSSLKTCNPNTVIFPEWKNEVTFTVFEQDNESNFKQQIIVINNIKTEETIAKPLSSILTPSQEQGGNTTLVR